MGKFISDALVPVVTTVLAVTSGYSAWKLASLDGQLKDLDAQLKRQELQLKESAEERQQAQSLRELNFKIYEAVKNALESEKNTGGQQEVARALVAEMADEPFRSGLLGVLKNSSRTDAEVGKAVAFDIAQQPIEERTGADVAPTPPASPTPSGLRVPASPLSTRSSKWSNWDIDFFWCESSGAEAQRLAEAALKGIKDPAATGRWRTRVVPDSVNARPGYRVRGYAIRRNEGEDTMALRLKEDLEKAVPGARFDVQATAQRTPYYLSVFFCPS